MSDITLVNGVLVGLGVNGGTTAPPISMIGADFFGVAVAWYASVPPPVLSDTESNVYMGLTAINPGSPFNPAVQLYYCANPIVSAAMQFTLTGISVYCSIGVFGFSGLSTVPYTGQESGNGNTAGTTSVQPGALTPSEDNCLVLTAACIDGVTTSIYSAAGYTVGQVSYNGAGWFGLGLGRQVQTTATLTDPTWEWGGDSIPNAAVAAVFRPSATGGRLQRPNALSGGLVDWRGGLV